MKNNKTMALVIFYNFVILGSFVGLAIHFSKWWVVLFSMLFTWLPKRVGYHRICDGCGKTSPYADSYSDAVNKALEAGWVRKHVENPKIRFDGSDNYEDYCPECRKNIEKKSGMEL